MNFLYKIIRRLLFWRSNFFQKFERNYYTWLAKETVSSYKEPLKVNRKSIFTKYTVLGANANFNGFEIHGSAAVTIGNNFHSGSGCRIITSFHNYEGTKIPYDHTYIHKCVTIADNVWLGDDVIIVGGVNIGEGVIIQAGSVVVSDIPNYAIAGGHPAKVFKHRDIEHYNQLKASNLFH